MSKTVNDTDGTEYEYDDEGNLVKKIKKNTTLKFTANVDENAIAKKVAEEMKQGEIEQKALEAFEREKRLYATQYNDKGFFDCKTPKELDDLAQQIENERSQPKPKTPNGKAIYGGGDSETFGSPEALLDDLYQKAYPRGIAIDTKEGAEARQKIEQLFEAWIYGKSWGQMKEKLRDGQHALPENMKSLTKCPKCGRSIESYPCPYCTYDPRDSKKKVNF